MSRPWRVRLRPLRPPRGPADAPPPPPKNVVKKSENGLESPKRSSISSCVIVRYDPPGAPPVLAFQPANGLAPPARCACSYWRQLAPSSSYFGRLAESPSTSYASL